MAGQGGDMLNVSMDFTSQILNDDAKHFPWLSKCWQLSFKYWRMKSIDRFTFSQLQPHNSGRPNVLAWKLHAIYMM